MDETFPFLTNMNKSVEENERRLCLHLQKHKIHAGFADVIYLFRIHETSYQALTEPTLMDESGVYSPLWKITATEVKRLES